MKVIDGPKGCWGYTGAAWLSSARVVRCSLQWGNERNPRSALQVSQETAAISAEEGGDDVKSAWPFDALGNTHATMDDTKGSQAARRSQSHKIVPSSDCGLQLARMKLDSLVIVDQLCHGEYVLKSCTHNKSAQQRIHLSG